MILQSGLTQLVKQQFQDYFEEWQRHSNISAADFHLQNMKALDLRHLSSTDTCLACGRRRPMLSLPDCQHCVCEKCITEYGRPDRDDPLLFHIDWCFVCDTKIESQKVVVRVDPPTVGTSVLCVDGGGTGGIIPLRVMQRIEEKIRDKVGGHIPLQTFFKLAFGVSSGKDGNGCQKTPSADSVLGGLIIAAMFLKGWSLEESANQFNALARRAFQRHPVARIPFLSYLHDIVKLCFADGIYSAQHIEQALKEVFGPERSILDYSHASTLGAKLGLPVATVHDRPSCQVFTNYNDASSTSDEPGLLIHHIRLQLLTLAGDGFIRPREGLGKVPLWEM